MCVCLWACVRNERNRKGTRFGCLSLPLGNRIVAQSLGLVARCCRGKECAALVKGVDRQQGCVFWRQLAGGKRAPAGPNSPGAGELGMGRKGEWA